jgi:flagellar basal body-associated protein FliL
MPAKPPAEGYRRTMSVILIILAVIAVCTVAVLVYWSTRGEPVRAPSAPQGEATIPMR